MKFLKASLATIVAALAAGAIALASTTIPSGTTINASMDNTLDSAKAYVGQRFTMHVVAPYPSWSLQGAYMTGHVIAVQHASQGRKPKLQLAVDQLVLRGGTSVNVYAQVTSVAQQKSGSNLGHAALTGLGGMLAGNLIGKTIFHTGIGGAVGLVGGALVGLNAKTNFTVPSGSRATVQVERTVIVRTQSHG